MPETLRDGKGRGNLAAVNSDNELQVRSVSVEERLAAAADELYFEATTGKITLTDANETGIIYILNSDTTKSLVIDRVFYDMWGSTGGSGGGTLKYYRNPTITGGTDITPNNTNFGSTRLQTGTFKKSLTTISGTVWWTAYFDAGSSIALEEGRIMLPNGSSFAISITAPTGNTSMDVSVNIAMYLFDTDLIS